MSSQNSSKTKTHSGNQRAGFLLAPHMLENQSRAQEFKTFFFVFIRTLQITHSSTNTLGGITRTFVIIEH